MACILLSTGCSARRNTPGTRAYHELTTRYNIYFNAEETYHAVLKERSENSHEDYGELLPFYPSISVTERPSSGGPFDPVIEKTGKAIQEHSLTAKPRRDPTKAYSQEYRQWLGQEEFNPFLKNVWLLRGKAYLQNGNYDEALSVFSGMLRLFSQDAELMNETEIWMLRTYTEIGRTYEAGKTAYALMNKRLPNHLEKLFTEHYTYFLIRKKGFTEAIPHLQKIITQESDHFRRKRLQFLLGQIYAITGEKNKAYQAFEEVKGLSTPFELTLNATLWQSALISGEQQQKIMHRLKKMEQKVNNTDSAAFFDQRYRIYLKADNDSLAQVFRPSKPDNHSEHEDTARRAVTDSIAGNAQTVENTPQRLSPGRTLAENAALHRQWRSRNGLWQRRPTDSTESAEGEKEKMIPFSADKRGPHYLLLTFTPGSTDKNRLLFTTADFNFSHFRLHRFNLSYIYLPGTEALQIEPFRSLEEVCRYTDIMYSDSIFRTTLPAGITPVIISEANLKLIGSEERMNEYNTFYAESIAPAQTILSPVRRDETVKIEEKNEEKPEKIVSLETPPVTIPEEREISAQPESIYRTEGETPREKYVQPERIQPAGRETPEALKRRLEENAAKALQQQQETGPRKSRQQLLKEREREREERIRQRERELKERQHKREAELKQRERERALKVKGEK